MLTIEFWQDTLIYSPNSFTYSAFKAYIVLISYISSIIYAGFAAFRFDVEGEHLQHEENMGIHEDDTIKKMNRLQLFFEITFIVYTLSHFLMECKHENPMMPPIRNFHKIATNYI